MSDRKYSDPCVWDNSIDGDDDPSGSDGGYDRHGNFINPRAMTELVLLRQQLAELREAARAYMEPIGHYEWCSIRAGLGNKCDCGHDALAALLGKNDEAE